MKTKLLSLVLFSLVGIALAQPSITDPTAINITENTAVLRALISSGSNFSVSAQISSVSAAAVASAPTFGSTSSTFGSSNFFFDALNLTPNTTYYYRINANNFQGSASSPVGTFTTLSVTPSITNINDVSTANTGIIMYTSTSPDGNPVSTVLSWGTTAAGLSNSLSNSSSSSPEQGIFTISGLQSAQVYYGQLVSLNSLGSTTSPVFTFTPGVAVAEYNFDGTYTNTNNNSPFESGSGISFGTDRNGNQNSALRIVNTATSATIPNLPYGNSPSTVSFWVQLVQPVTSTPFLFSYGSTAALQDYTGYLQDDSAFIGPQNNNHGTTTQNAYQGWNNYVYTYDGSTSRIYRNGVLIGSGTFTWNTTNVNDIFRLGSRINGTGTINGSIDDLKIFNRPLSQLQVTQLFQANAIQREGAPEIVNVGALPPANNPIITYYLNGSTQGMISQINYGTTSTALNSTIAGSTFTDFLTAVTGTIPNLIPGTTYYYQIVATNSNGTSQSSIFNFTTNPPLSAIANYTFDNTLSDVNGANAFAFNNGLSYGTDRLNIANKALFINGTGTTVSLTNLPVGNSSRTFSFWIKPTQSNGSNRIFSYGSPTGSAAYGASFDATRVYNFSWTTNLSFLQSTSLNVWKHIVCTYEQSTSTASLYTDGVLRASITANWSTANNGIFYLGSLFGETGSRYIGFLDDLQIYNSALSQADITSLYTNNTLSSQDFSQNNLEVALYPNPVNDILNIETALDIQTVEIFNLQGQKVLSSNQKQINTQNISAGIYLVNITDTNNNKISKKIIKK